VVEQASDGDLPPEGGGGPVHDDVAKLAGRPATGLRAVLEANRNKIMEAALDRAK
jgi:hypothetical protein